MTKFYFAFGSNLHKKQMKNRCSDSEELEKLIIKDWQLLYRNGVATIERKLGSVVPGAIYKISKQDEKHLDRYEGYPRYYIKKYFKYNNRLIMFYVLPSIRAKMSLPSLRYFNTIMEGYCNWNLPVKDLYNSLKYTRKNLNKKSEKIKKTLDKALN